MKRHRQEKIEDCESLEEDRLWKTPEFASKKYKKNSYLTFAEAAIVENLGECMTAYAKLSHHEMTKEGDCREFAHHIHVLQRQVMARLAQRAHPDKFIRGRI